MVEEEVIQQAIAAHERTLAAVKTTLPPQIARIADCLNAAVRAQRTIFWCGNGGSAADAQHLAAELIGRFERERRAVASVALTTDSSIVTSVGNDYGFDAIFSRQIEGLGRPGDVLVGISTSGNSPNVLAAVKRAKALGLLTVGLLGKDGGALRGECELSLVVPADNTARVQEMHILIGHILCDLVERSLE